MFPKADLFYIMYINVSNILKLVDKRCYCTDLDCVTCIIVYNLRYKLVYYMCLGLFTWLSCKEVAKN